MTPGENNSHITIKVEKDNDDGSAPETQERGRRRSRIRNQSRSGSRSRSASVSAIIHSFSRVNRRYMRTAIHSNQTYDEAFMHTMERVVIDAIHKLHEPLIE